MNENNRSETDPQLSSSKQFESMCNNQTSQQTVQGYQSHYANGSYYANYNAPTSYPNPVYNPTYNQYKFPPHSQINIPPPPPHFNYSTNLPPHNFMPQQIPYYATRLPPSLPPTYIRQTDLVQIYNQQQTYNKPATAREEPSKRVYDNNAKRRDRSRSRSRSRNRDCRYRRSRSKSRSRSRRSRTKSRSRSRDRPRDRHFYGSRNSESGRYGNNDRHDSYSNRISYPNRSSSGYNQAKRNEVYAKSSSRDSQCRGERGGSRESDMKRKNDEKTKLTHQNNSVYVQTTTIPIYYVKDQDVK